MDPNESVSYEAREALEQVCPDKAALTSIFLDAFKRERGEGRTAIARPKGAPPTPRSTLSRFTQRSNANVGFFRQLWRAPELEARKAALCGLADLGAQDEESYSIYLEALRDQGPDIRYNAARGLVKMDQAARRAVPALIEAFEAADDYSRCEIARALAVIDPEAAAV